VQTAQSAHAVIVPKTDGDAADNSGKEGPTKRVKLSAMDAASAILKKDGLSGFWRGIGPALILVINPIIQVSENQQALSKSEAENQYTTFERLVSVLLSYRLARQGVSSTGKPMMGRSALTDWDMFILGAASKLVATGTTYPYVSHDL